MKKKFRFLTQALTAIMVAVAPVMSVSADDTALISISGGNAAENEVTDITVSADGGVKAAAFTITLDFDPELLEFVDAKGLLDDGLFCYNAVDEGSVKFVWSNDKDIEIDGSIFSVCFKTRGESSGNEAEISVGDSIIGSDELGELDYDVQDGVLNISADYKWGDANCDGSVDLADVVALDKYCTDIYFELPEQGVINADVNNDTTVNELDGTRVMTSVKNKTKEAIGYEG